MTTYWLTSRRNATFAIKDECELLLDEKLAPNIFPRISIRNKRFSSSGTYNLFSLVFIFHVPWIQMITFLLYVMCIWYNFQKCQFRHIIVDYFNHRYEVSRFITFHFHFHYTYVFNNYFFA